MNWSLLLPLLVTTVVAIIGWIVGHRLGAARDQKNKRRDVRLGFLLEAYRRLEAGASRGPLHDTEFADGFESAFADIQLLGTKEQIELANDLSRDIASKSPHASVDLLLLSLRDELRRELSLEPIEKPPFQFRWERSKK